MEDWKIKFGGSPMDDGFTIVDRITNVLVCELWPAGEFDRTKIAERAQLITFAPRLLEIVARFSDHHHKSKDCNDVQERWFQERWSLVADADRIIRQIRGEK